MEEPIKIIHNNIEIDGLFHQSSKEKTAVITHPHPLYGGNMYNNVVDYLQGEFEKKGYSTLRFNFRQLKEPLTDQDSFNDVETVISFLAGKGFGNNLMLAGYSYGSWINAQAMMKGVASSDNIMVSPPVTSLDYKEIKALPGPGLVVTGSEDDIAPPDQVEKKIPDWNPEFEFKIIEGCDHFYGGFGKELQTIVSEYLIK